MLARRLKMTEVADYFFSCKHHAIERCFYHFPPLAKALPEKRRRHADCKLDGSMQMRWRSECFLRSIFHLLPGADRLESRAPSFFFLFLYVSLAREVIAARFSANIASDPIPDAVYWTGVFERAGT